MALMLHYAVQHEITLSVLLESVESLLDQILILHWTKIGPIKTMKQLFFEALRIADHAEASKG